LRQLEDFEESQNECEDVVFGGGRRIQLTTIWERIEEIPFGGIRTL